MVSRLSRVSTAYHCSYFVFKADNLVLLYVHSQLADRLVQLVSLRTAYRPRDQRVYSGQIRMPSDLYGSPRLDDDLYFHSGLCTLLAGFVCWRSPVW